MSLRDSAVKGVVWTSIGTVGAGLLNFILTMILARVLSPSDYGLLELLAIFTILSECFIDSGFSQAVIKDQNASQTDLSSVFFFNLTIALVLYIGLFFAAPLIANFYHEPSLIKLSRFVFLVIIFHSCSIIQNDMVLFAFLRMLFYWLFSSWRPSFVVSFKSIEKYFKFGVNLLIQGLIDKFVTNLESLMIGRVYTKSDLGYFSQAKKLDSYFAQTSISVVQKVTYPILAKIGNDVNQLKNGYRRVLGITMFVMVPVLFFCVASADNFFSQWGKSEPFLRLWCICGLLVGFQSIFNNIFLVTNNTKRLLYLSMIKQSVRLIVIFCLINISVMALMYGIVGVSLFSAVLYCFFGGRLIDYKVIEITKDLLPTISIAFIAALSVFCLGWLMSSYNRFLVFALQIVLMFVLYWLGSFILKNKSYLEIKGILLSLTASFVKRKGK